MTLIPYVGPGQYAAAGTYIAQGSAMPGYASPDDVRSLLGPLGGRLPASVNIEAQLSIARADVRASLHQLYGERLPAVERDPDAVELLRWAEAKLAASGALSTMLVSLPEALQDAPARLRREARETLGRPVPGFDPNAGPDPDRSGPQLPVAPVSVGVSSAAVSVFRDPYSSTWNGGRVLVPRTALNDPDGLWWEA